MNIVETDLYERMYVPIDSNKGPGSDEIPVAILKMMAEVLVDPLLMIFNKSLQQGRFPSQWKTSNIIPIFKTGDRTLIENYRGIAILSAIPKLFEKIVTKHISQFLSDKIDPHQHGFHQGRSTTTNMVYYASHLLQTCGQNKQVDSIYTDFSKAFDKVNHEILECSLKLEC